ncbi:MAG: isopeptide-forming domain-containing fimbrial protein [Oscillospiraceae bacterium]|nr:isopeptide-forming domain-containing fimbrial protein [Oscillospiraceae bacterium]
MKHARKLASLLLALVMVFALATTAFAAESTTISAPAGSSRSYDVYQIFTGDLNAGVLSNVKWGKNGTGTEGNAVDQTILEALAAVNGKSNTEKLTEIQKYVNLNSEKIGTVSNGSPLTVTTGYYLIKDNGPVNNGEAYSLYVVEIVGSTIISPKVGTTTSDKKVKDTNDSAANSTTDWQDSADYDIGDAVPFKLSATIAQDYANYTHGYKLTFHDKEDDGLRFNKESVKVYVDGAVIPSDFTVVTEDLTDGCTFEVRFTNLKEIASVHAGSVISVEYTSTLKTNAVVGSTGNKNTSHVTYTNNPNDEQAGEGGKTPNDVVIVFTYKTIVNKVTKNPAYDASKDTEKTGIDSDGNTEFISLKGAGFTLYKKNASGEYVAVGSELKGDDMTTFTWSGLDDGDYKLVETTTPAGYNTIADIEFTITAGHVDGDSPNLNTLSGNVTSGTATFTAVVNDGSLSTDVVNNSGTTLPSTGGMGTTIFYVLGSILAVGAIVLLVTKKRMSAAD